MITLLLFTDGDRDQITSPLSQRKLVAAQKRKNWDFLEAGAPTTNSPSFPHFPRIFCFNSQHWATAHWKRKRLPFCPPDGRWVLAGCFPVFSGEWKGPEEQRVPLRGDGRSDAAWWGTSCPDRERAAGPGPGVCAGQDTGCPHSTLSCPPSTKQPLSFLS